MDKRKHSEFDMVKLVSKRKFEREPGSKEFPPAIPLSEEDFKTMMMTTKITHSFNSVTLKFGINQGLFTLQMKASITESFLDLLDFRQTYLSLRQHWLEDTPPIE